VGIDEVEFMALTKVRQTPVFVKPL